MSQLDRTHDRSAEFDQSLQAVLGLAWLLSQVGALGPVSGTAGAGAGVRAPFASSGDHDLASLAVLGVIAVAGELSPLLEALRTDSPQRVNVPNRAGPRDETDQIEPEDGGDRRRNQVGLAGLLR
jgi:hypothetical protein